MSTHTWVEEQIVLRRCGLRERAEGRNEWRARRQIRLIPILGFFRVAGGIKQKSGKDSDGGRGGTEAGMSGERKRVEGAEAEKAHSHPQLFLC
jgi:hypothetical protein